MWQPRPSAKRSPDNLGQEYREVEENQWKEVLHAYKSFKAHYDIFADDFKIYPEYDW